MHLLDPFGFGRHGYERHAAAFHPLPRAEGLVVAITGANSGLGLAATAMLAGQGATVWMLCRDLRRAEQARRSLDGDIHIAEVDVARPASIAALRVPPPDVLVHNAGMLADRYEQVGELERTVATHVVGPWLLGQRLQPATTIWVASGGMYTQRLDVDATFHPPRPFDGVRAYARCKRAQVVLARRAGQQAMHPGWADSPGVQRSLPRFHRLTRDILRTPAQGADTIAWLALTRPAPGFWFDRAPAREHVLPWTRGAAGEEDRLLQHLATFTLPPVPEAPP